MGESGGLKVIGSLNPASYLGCIRQHLLGQCSVVRYDINIILTSNTNMKQKIAITLDEELVVFLDAQANGNRSDYLNSVLDRQRKLCLKAELIAALKDDIEALDYQQEVAVWDSVAGDGIDAFG